MTFHSIRIVLVGTSHPGNIGSTARAMKTMGLSKLYLVSPRVFPHPNAIELAAGADDVLADATVVDSLEEALKGCHLIIATSARPRGLSLPGLLPAESAELVASLPENTEIAFVFGREYAGLTNAELLHCHYHVHIPAAETYSSLNLSQAVQIIAYELRIKLLSPPCKVTHKSDLPATADDVERFFAHLKTVLITTEFLKPENPRRLMDRMRRLFTRVQLEEMEVQLLRGMLTQIERALERD